ncbi:uncharacterized protein LOC111615973 [Centruroides sculpturatus]|uniref:uncharacterized protein LOC111615973 n=1 Tax=Centruroides sculpturatus TaxID=218467 RepID=UPI000C6CD74C|nr:uncharacterized protein LOC111615973 [Centruroides sculpturatus]
MNFMLVGILFCAVIVTSQALVCRPETCSKIVCEDLEGCEGRNGVVKEKGGFCGCCDLCVVQLREGEPCPLPLLGVPPRSECAEGLQCNSHTGTCQRY